MMLAIFIVGVLLLGWHRTHEHLRKTRRDYQRAMQANERLLELQREAHEAIKPTPKPRRSPSPEHWADRPYERLAADLGLRLVDVEASREAHSHAESALRKDSA